MKILECKILVFERQYDSKVPSNHLKSSKKNLTVVGVLYFAYDYNIIISKIPWWILLFLWDPPHRWCDRSADFERRDARAEHHVLYVRRRQPRRVVRHDRLQVLGHDCFPARRIRFQGDSKDIYLYRRVRSLQTTLGRALLPLPPFRSAFSKYFLERFNKNTCECSKSGILPLE